MDELFVTCLNNNSENKLAKPIENYLDLFINTSLNHIFIRSRLESQPKNKLISISEQLFHARDLSPITFRMILPPSLRGKNSTISQINPGTLYESKNSKVRTIKILLDSGANVLIICKDVLYERYTILKDKKNKWSTMAGTIKPTFETNNNIKIPIIESFRRKLRKIPFDK